MDALARSITAKQFVEVWAFNQMEPFGDRRADHYLALIAQTVYNMAVSAKDRSPLEDFILWSEDGEEKKKKPKQAPKQTVEKQIAIIHAYCAAAAASQPAPEGTG